MADDQGEHYNFDLELYCIVCDRAIDPTSPLPTTTNLNPPSAPSPSPRLASPSTHTSPAPPNSTPSSSRSHNAPPPSLSAPKLKRTGSGHSTTSNGQAKVTGGLKRNKSSGKIHHHAAGGGAHRRNYSHANLHALAPMTNDGGKGKRVTVTGVGPAAEKVNSKQAVKELERERERERAKEEASTRHFDSASTLYCSEECRQIDEARNQLTITHLGGSESSSPAPFPLSSPSQATSRSDDFDEDEEPYISLARRRSSGMSSTGSTSYTFSSTGERGLSPIMSAAPTSNPSPYFDSSGFPFPSVSSTSTRLAHNNSQTNMHSHASNSSLNSLPSQQSYQGAPPLLNFSSRRQSRGAHSSGAYSYRPSLMERVHSTDSNDSGVSDRAMSRGARSLSITGGFSTGLFNRVRSMDGLSMLGKSDSETSDREGRQANTHRQNSALSSLRSMTPISNAPPIPSPSRSRPPLANSRYSEPSSASPREHDRPSATRISSDSRAISQSRSRSRSRKPPQTGLPHRARSRPPPTTSPLIAGSDPPPPIVGSLPVERSRGLSLGSPTSTTSLLRPVPVSPNPLLASRRTSSSASLALLGSSLSKSHDHRSGLTNPWVGPKRSDSTAGLSGLVAMGEISAPSASTSPFPPSSSSTASTFIPAPSSFHHRHHPPQSQRPRRPSSSNSQPHSSPSSATSSFAHSHSSVRTSSSSRRSTAASSDHWQGVVSSSLGSNPSHSSGMHRTRSGSSSRPDRPSTGTSSTGERGGGGSNRVKQGGLTMTPSHTNLPAMAPPSPTPRTHSSLAPPIPSASSNTTPKQNLGGQVTNASRTWSWTNLHVPTYQALDVGEFRAKKERDEKVAVPGEERNGGETAALPPQLRKDRKRLFHFADTGDAE